jgi:hypothetical protein
MPYASRPPSPAQLLNDLQYSAELQRQTVAAAGLDPQLAMLRGWQANRLARTYADLLADPRYSPACAFFLENIYAPTDFSQRDHDLDRIYRFLSRVFPPEMIALLAETVELNGMTNTLDDRLLRVLVDQLGVTDSLTAEHYTKAYGICDNYAARARQIEIIESILSQVGEGAHLLVVGAALKLAKIPAQRAGWADVYDFLARGRQAFRQMKDPQIFVDTITRRELRILDLIYAPDLPGFMQLAGLL